MRGLFSTYAANTFAGYVAIFKTDSAWRWRQRGSVLTASDAGESDYFGIAVALSADGAVLAVGAYAWDVAALTTRMAALA